MSDNYIYYFVLEYLIRDKGFNGKTANMFRKSLNLGYIDIISSRNILNLSLKYENYDCAIRFLELGLMFKVYSSEDEFNLVRKSLEDLNYDKLNKYIHKLWELKSKL